MLLEYEIIKKFFYKIIKKSPVDFEIVRYWKKSGAVAAKVIKSKEGHLIMKLENEKYPFPTYPRGYLLFGKLSKLKHEIKIRYSMKVGGS